MEDDNLEKIDFVIPWVDSDDPLWRKRRNKALANTENSIDDSENISEERYRDYGTLKYLFRSIEKYANWVNHIYLITDNQRPMWMNSDLSQEVGFANKLKIIDHKDIMPAEALPSFNSNAIEFNILNIPELSEHFVAFNDDIVINDIVNPNDFFKNGMPRDFRIYVPLKPYSSYDNILFNNSKLINQWLKGSYESKKGMFSLHYGVSILKNFQHYYLENGHYISNYSFPHNAQSFLKSAFRSANTIWKNEIQATVSNHFRTNDDLSTLLIRDYQLEHGYFSPRSPKFSQYYRINQINQIRKELLNSTHKLICINDAETDNYESDIVSINKLLQQKFPEKSSFEI